jgi:adenosylmethionine-8-amino-7-oxononanoate aminotransferase
LLLALEICAPNREPFQVSPCIPDRLRQIALRNGMLLYARRVNEGRFGDWVMITPPLTITRAQCDEYLVCLDKTLATLALQLRDSGQLT